MSLPTVAGIQTCVLIPQLKDLGKEWIMGFFHDFFWIVTCQIASRTHSGPTLDVVELLWLLKQLWLERMFIEQWVQLKSNQGLGKGPGMVGSVFTDFPKSLNPDIYSWRRGGKWLQNKQAVLGKSVEACIGMTPVFLNFMERKQPCFHQTP